MKELTSFDDLIVGQRILCVNYENQTVELYRFEGCDENDSNLITLTDMTTNKVFCCYADETLTINCDAKFYLANPHDEITFWNNHNKEEKNMEEINISKRIDSLEQSINEIKDALKALADKPSAPAVPTKRVYTIDGIEVPAEIYEHVKEIVDYIDFERVIITMDALDWTLCTCDGPITKEFLRKHVIELCVDCYKKLRDSDCDAYTMATGGWYVRCQKYEDGKININASFRVEDIDSYELLY